MNSVTRLPEAFVAPGPTAAPSVDVVVPVHNEQGVLPATIRRLHDFLSAALPLVRWRIVIADNASTDATPAIAAALADEPARRRAAARSSQKGRGRALRAAWSAQRRRDVVATWTSTSRPTCARCCRCVAPLLSGHSDVAIGTRLANGSHVVRGAKRELISRAYNRILHTVLRRALLATRSAASRPCARDAARELLADVRDEGWFFDTELLVLAQRRGLRIHEVPVDWVDDPDSRVDIVRTALDGPAAASRGCWPRAPIVRFMAHRRRSRTLAYALLYLALRGPLGPAGANAAGAGAHRRRQHAREPAPDASASRAGRPAAPPRSWALVVFVLTLGLTSGALAVLHGARSRARRARSSWRCSSSPAPPPRSRATSR